MREKLLYRYINGETTPAEEADILAWLDADPVLHVRQLNDIRYICSAIDENILSRQTAVRKPRRFTLSLRRMAGYAAGAAAAVAALVGANYLGQRSTYDTISSRMTTLEVPAGQRLSMTLEDGTQVWLNAGTRLEYPAAFAQDSRRVKLSGEAMFEVTHNADRPFIVETFASEIEVVGTKFNVIAEEQFDRFSTLLINGRVKVSNINNPHERIYMEPDQVVNLVGGHLTMQHATDISDLCWTEGLMNIRRMPFDELMAKFEKAYDVKIVIERETLPRINVLSGEVRISDGVDYALGILQQVSDFTYEKDRETNTIIIR